MGTSEYDSMLEIFFSESYELLKELERILIKGKEMKQYSKDEVQDIFRIFHTIKADATMMLFEDIAEVASTFEKILYYYREKEEGIVDTTSFNEYMERILVYFIEELEKIEKIGDSSGTSKKLIEELLNYKNTLTDRNEFEVKEKEKQVYYIAGVEKETVSHLKKSEPNRYIDKNKKPKKITTDQETSENYYRLKIPEKYDKKKHNIVTNEEMQKIKKIQNSFEDILENYRKRLQNNNLIAFEEEDLKQLFKIDEQLRQWIRYVDVDDFKDIAMKMTQVTNEMSGTLEKDIELIITGTETIIEKNKVGKISNAMIHLLRNAIDHGIETREERIACGKPKRGRIQISIVRKEKDLTVKIEDDGRGIDCKKILKKAKEQHILTKPESDYTKEDIYQIMLQHGFSTNEIITNYSGLGVGMDVVEHNITELNGHISIKSEPGKGTEVTLYFLL